MEAATTDCHQLTQSGRAKSLCLLLVSVLFVLLQTPPGLAQSNPELALEITVPDSMMPRILVGGRHGVGSGLIRRASLMITDPNAAGGFTAIDVTTIPEGNAIRVTLSVMYSEVNVQDLLRRDYKPGGSYLIREGETARASELSQFGIEPFEMKVISAAPIVLKPGEGPRIVNNTTALKVERLEKHLNSYSIWLKNVSNKDIVAYGIVNGRSVLTDSRVKITGRPAIAAGATSLEKDMSTSGR